MQITSTGRSRLMLSEYGRNVQKMVEYLKSIEDRELRNRQAQVVVGIMGNLYPYKRDTEAFRNMLWDHLFMIAEFDIDIDCPYPKPTRELFSPVAARVPYNQKRIAQKHYGNHVNCMLSEVLSSDASAEDKELVVANLAKYMRQSAYNYNNEYPSNEVVLADIKKMAGGSLEIDAQALSGSNVIANRDGVGRQNQPRTGFVKRTGQNNNTRPSSGNSSQGQGSSGNGQKYRTQNNSPRLSGQNQNQSQGQNSNQGRTASPGAAQGNRSGQQTPRPGQNRNKK